jgi:hypothetical protein
VLFTMAPMSTAPTSPPFGGWSPFAGRFAPPVFFEDPPVPPAPPAPTPPAPPAPTPPAPTGDLDALQAALDESARTGATSALQPLMTAIGVDSAEALQEWITARHAEIEAGKDEQTRAREAAERDAADARAQAIQAQADARDARIDAALAVAGAPGDNVTDLRRLVDVAADADSAAITAAVEAVKTKYPALFTPGAPSPTPPAPPHRPPTPPAPTPPGDPLAAGRERAKAAAASRTGATKEDLLNQFTPQRSPLLPTS